MATATFLTLAGFGLTLAIWIAGAIFGAGGLKARMEALEKWQTGVDKIIAQGGLEHRIKSLEEWRINMRSDMHEISDILQRIERNQTRLEERVGLLLERRVKERHE